MLINGDKKVLKRRMLNELRFNIGFIPIKGFQ
jgi:hypothetical protein